MATESPSMEGPNPNPAERPLARPSAPSTNVPPGASSPAPLPSDDDAAAAAISLWQHPFVQDVLPFLTSLLLHVGLLVIGLLTYQAVKAVVSTHVEQVIIPEAQMVTSGPE